MLEIATVGALAATTFKTVFDNLVAEQMSKSLTFGLSDKFKVDLKPHLEATFNKCVRIKTLINPATQSDFLSLYSTQRFKVNDKVIDHYEFVRILKDSGKRVIVSGTGGAGKSMFMKYLWLSYFVDGGGNIPIFVELRNLNKVTSSDIVPYLYHTVTRGRSRITIDKFKSGLSKGEFYIILDGYDELNESIRHDVQQGIIDFADDYPEVTIVISSRPDDKFASWNNFDLVEISHLTKEDAIELIEKVEFDESIKVSFIEKIKDNNFYNSNKSFLQNPLLASMMLLAFSQNYDIPDKMHQFYELAYEALFKRHDSYKPGGFKREFFSTSDEDEFKRVLSYFSLLTFYHQKFSFSNSYLGEVVSEAIELNGSNFKSEKYIYDLCNSVCILVKEGNQFIFPHRSFQEYFAAYCLAHVTRKNFQNIILGLIKRRNENAVVMIRDMNPELLRDEFVVPISIKYKDYLKNVASESNIAKFMKATDFNIQLVSVGRNPKSDFQFHFMINSDGEFDNIVDLFNKLSGGNNEFELRPKKGYQSVDIELSNALSDVGINYASRVNIWSDGAKIRSEVIRSKEEKVIALDENSERIIVDAVLNSFLYNFVSKRMKLAAEYSAREIEIASKSTMKMGSIFGE